MLKAKIWRIMLLGFVCINYISIPYSNANTLQQQELVMPKATIIEMVIYTTKDGVDVEQHRQKAAAVAELLAKMPGFVSRNFSKSTDGKWVDLVYWENMQFAKTAAAKFMDIAETQSFIADINEDDMQFLHTEILSSIAP